jgi:hypothetical protein
MARIENPKTGEIFEIEDTPEARNQALSKGYAPLVLISNPKTNEAFEIDDREVGEAVKKGYQIGPIQQAPERTSVAGDIGRGILGGLEALEKRTAAPVRAGIGALIDEKPETGFFGAAFEKLKDPEKPVPTGKEISAKLGLSEEETIPIWTKAFPKPGEDPHIKVSPAGMAGLAVEMLTDPLTYVGGSAVKQATKVLAAPGAVLRGKPVKETAKALANTLFDVPPQYADEIMMNPNVIDQVRTIEELEDVFVGGVNKLRQTVFQESDSIAAKTLSEVKKYDRNEFLQGIDDILTKADIPGSATSSDKIAMTRANEITETIVNKGESLSELDLKGIIKKIDREVNWKDPNNTTANGVLKQIRSVLDTKLKDGNKSYASAMEQLAPKARQLDAVTKELAVGKQGDQLIGTDRTVGKLRSMFNAKGQAKRRHAAEQLEGLGKFTDNDQLLQELKLSRIEEVTEGGVTAGSRKVAGGAIAGTPGGIPGAIAGAAAGAFLDRYGRKIGKSFLKAAGPTAKTVDEALEITGRFLPSLPKPQREILEMAAKEGTRSLIIMHHFMKQVDRDYANTVKDMITQAEGTKAEEPDLRKKFIRQK